MMSPWSLLVLFASWLPAVAVVPEPLRASIERVESGGNACAVSSSGCVGLMQVCPRWSLVPAAMLTDPMINRLEGARILADDLRAAGGNWRRALAGYRCGGRGLRGQCGSVYARRVLALARKMR